MMLSEKLSYELTILAGSVKYSSLQGRLHKLAGDALVMESFIEDWNKYFPDAGPREISARIAEIEKGE